MKKWRCTVCGYIHEGEEPPEKCPVCGADKSKFVEVFDEDGESRESSEVEQQQASSEKRDDNAYKKIVSKYSVLTLVTSQIKKHHLHPITVHFPNGVIPLSFIFIILAVVFNAGDLAQASFYNLIAVVLAMPVVLISGYVDFQEIYGGNRTSIFLTKMICGAVVSATALMLVIWYLIDSSVLFSSGFDRWIFIGISMIMLAAAGIAGFLGGKLVFKD